MEERIEYRNWTYPHQHTTRVGTISLRVPRIRGGKFSTELFARYQWSSICSGARAKKLYSNGDERRGKLSLSLFVCGKIIRHELSAMKQPNRLIHEKSLYLLQHQCSSSINFIFGRPVCPAGLRSLFDDVSVFLHLWSNLSV
jgi:hypothetical protein